MGAHAAFTEGRTADDWLHPMYDEMRPNWQKRGADGPPFEAFWEDGLFELSAEMESRTMFSEFRSDPKAHPLSTPSGRIEIFLDTIAGFGLPDYVGHPAWSEPREWLGPATDGAFHLLTDQPARKLHSQLDPSPHSVGGKVLARERMFMNPADAQRSSVSQHDVVEVRNARGRCQAAGRRRAT